MSEQEERKTITGAELKEFMDKTRESFMKLVVNNAGLTGSEFHKIMMYLNLAISEAALSMMCKKFEEELKEIP